MATNPPSSGMERKENISRLPKPTPARNVAVGRNPIRKSLGGVQKTVNSPRRFRVSSTSRRDPTVPLPSSHYSGRVTVATSSNLMSGRIASRTAGKTPNVRAPLSTVNSRITSRSGSPVIGAKSKIPTDKEKLAELQTEFAATKALLEAKEQLIQATVMTTAQYQSQLAQSQATLALREAEKQGLQSLLQSKESENQLLLEKVAELEQNAESLRGQVLAKDNNMRDLHNLVVDLKGQIRVITRTRSFLPHEDAQNFSASHIEYPSRNSIKITVSGKETIGRVQAVYTHSANQIRVFEGLEDLILSTLHGYNVAIIAYGQTGAGKTFTMRGEAEEKAGVIPRSVFFLLSKMDELNDLGWKFKFSASFIEIYNEEIYDLLDKDKPKMNALMQGDRVTIPNLTKRIIKDQEGIDSLLAEADNMRVTAATKCNSQSSRSHAVFSLYVSAQNEKTGQSTQSVLNLVDLAGSERGKESQVVGERFTEMKNINHGLTQLQMCIRAQQTKQAHIPYRSSKLTMVLSDSLGGGKSKTLVLVCINPSAAAMNESKRSIEFAQQLTKTNIGIATKQENNENNKEK